MVRMVEPEVARASNDLWASAASSRLRVVSGAVINVNVVEACRRLAQAHLTRPGLTDIDRCPVQNLGTASLPNLDRMRHTDFRKNMYFLIF